MDRVGYIREKKDIKFLTLYAMALLPRPVPEETLLDLCLLDDAFGYLEFKDAFAELLSSDHVEKTDGGGCPLFSITEKGRAAAHLFEAQLPSSIRDRARRSAMRVLYALRRMEAIHTESSTRPDGSFLVHFSIGEGSDPLLSLALPAPTDGERTRMEQNFRMNAEAIYKGIVDLLMTDPVKED